jgi:uracil-DNA glycosylase/uncharacterized protein YeaO (DUF488 family)
MRFDTLLHQVRSCTLCAGALPHAPRPVVQLHPQARLLVASQAPGRKVHASGVPFDDASGERLREWMGVSNDVFYDARRVAIVPMGFCFPGSAKSGDLPPRPECAPAWREKLLGRLPHLKMQLVIGQYAQAYHLDASSTVTENVKAWRTSWPDVVPLPHPSPRNNIWLRRNPWFEAELLPKLQARIAELLGDDRVSIELKRVYDLPARSDGCRILVERLWPRGLSKSAAKVDLWAKDVAPSAELRRWFSHDPDKWPEFKKRYFAELRANPHAVEELLDQVRAGAVTFVFASKETRYNNAVALREFTRRKQAKRKST